MNINTCQFQPIAKQARRGAFCIGASIGNLQSNNKMSPTNLKAYFYNFLSIVFPIIFQFLGVFTV